MRKLNINVTLIPRENIKAGKSGSGKYLDLVMFENRDGVDRFGNDGFIALDVTKEEREAGKKGVIIGNWKEIGGKPAETRPLVPLRKAPPQAREDFSNLDGPDIPY